MEVFFIIFFFVGVSITFLNYYNTSLKTHTTHFFNEFFICFKNLCKFTFECLLILIFYLAFHFCHYFYFIIQILKYLNFHQDFYLFFVFYFIIFNFEIFLKLQIVRKERPLYVQTANCVEEKDWVDLLNKICENNKKRQEFYHNCAYINGEWTW